MNDLSAALFWSINLFGFFVIIIALASGAVHAALQKYIAKWIALKFMNIQISGAIFWSCFLGNILAQIILGLSLALASGTTSEWVGGMISLIGLIMCFLAAYPFFLIWVKKICRRGAYRNLCAFA